MDNKDFYVMALSSAGFEQEQIHAILTVIEDAVQRAIAELEKQHG